MFPAFHFMVSELQLDRSLFLRFFLALILWLSKIWLNKIIPQILKTTPFITNLIPLQICHCSLRVYLNPGDHPWLNLGSVPLIETNYIAWSHKIITALMAKGKLGYINGKLTKPEEGAVEYNMKPGWNLMLYCTHGLGKVRVGQLNSSISIKNDYIQLQTRLPFCYHLNLKLWNLSYNVHVVAANVR